VSAKGWDILHQGAKADIIGDYDFRNRVYSPTLGRWLTNDPIGFSAGDVNTFRYVGNGPGNKVDSKGLWPETDVTQPEPNQGGNPPITPPNPNNGLPSWYIPQIPKPFPVYDTPTITIVPPTDWGYPGSKMIQIPPVEFHLPTEGSPGRFGPRPDQMTIPPGIHASTPIFPPGGGNGFINTHIGFDGKFDITGGYRDGVPGSGHEHGGEFSITNNDPKKLNPIFDARMWYQLPNGGSMYFGGAYTPGGYGIPNDYEIRMGIQLPGGPFGNRIPESHFNFGIIISPDINGATVIWRF
jgi:RHS repeat-associated protein